MGMHFSEIRAAGALTQMQTRDLARQLWDESSRHPGGLSQNVIALVIAPFRAHDPSLSFSMLKDMGWFDAPEIAQRRGVAAGKSTLSDLTGMIANAPVEPRMSFEEACWQVNAVINRLQSAPQAIEGVGIRSLYLFGSAVRDVNARATIGDLDLAAEFTFDARYKDVDAKTRSEMAREYWNAVIAQGDERLQLGDAAGLGARAQNPAPDFALVKLWEDKSTPGSAAPQLQLKIDAVIEATLMHNSRARIIAHLAEEAAALKNDVKPRVKNRPAAGAKTPPENAP